MRNECTKRTGSATGASRQQRARLRVLHAMDPVVIESNRTLKGVFADLWDYRELFLFLAWRDPLVRYKQTAIGLAWSVITPLLTMAILTLVFGRLAKLPAGVFPTRSWSLRGCCPGSSSAAYSARAVPRS